MFQAEKRAHHNALERKRRDHIKDSFSSLRDSVPSLQGEKVVRNCLVVPSLQGEKGVRNYIVQSVAQVKNQVVSVYKYSIKIT